MLPIGIVEAHGPHMDLTADFYLSTLNCRFLKQKLSEIGVEALITPPFFWGISNDVARYAGTFSIRPETMKGLLTDIFMSLKSWGFRRIFVKNAHGDPIHIDMIKSAIAEANDDPDFRVYFMWELGIKVENNIIFPQMREDRYQPDYHAGLLKRLRWLPFFRKRFVLMWLKL